MLAVLTLVVILVVSLLVVRVATVALSLTGLSRQLARFQARSAFTGAGFTTSESERVVSHPVRRRIIMLLMLLGNAGIVTAVSTLILSFMNIGEAEGLFGTVWFRMLVLIGALVVLLIIAHSKWVDFWMSRLIAVALRKWTTLDVRDYANLLHLTGEYGVVEMQVQPGDWLANRRLEEMRLKQEGVLVLGIERDGQYIGTPRGETPVEPGDTLLLYGRRSLLQELDQRRKGPAGSRAHVEAVADQQQVQKAEHEEVKAKSGEKSKATQQ